MVDKVKPLKIEDTSSGTELDYLPREADPSEDYLSSKGLAFENLDTHLAEKLGDLVGFKVPNWSLKPTFTGDNLTSVEFFNGATQTTINRRAKADISYNGDDPTTETWSIYDTSDGTTVLRTITLTHTWSSGDLTKTVQT